MSKKQDFLDSTQQHTLSEQECELIALFRLFNKGQRSALIRLMFQTAMNDKKTAPKQDK